MADNITIKLNDKDTQWYEEAKSRSHLRLEKLYRMLGIAFFEKTTKGSTEEDVDDLMGKIAQELSLLRNLDDKLKSDRDYRTCPDCEAILRKSASHCYVCGHAFSEGEIQRSDGRTCPECNAELKEGMYFCPECGAIVADMSIFSF